MEHLRRISSQGSPPQDQSKLSTISAFDRKRQQMNRGSARVPSWLGRSNRSKKTARPMNTMKGSNNPNKQVMPSSSCDDTLPNLELSMSSDTSQGWSFREHEAADHEMDNSSQKTLPTVLDSLMGGTCSSQELSSSETAGSSSHDVVVEDIPSTVFLATSSAGVSKTYRHKMEAECVGDRFGPPPSSSVDENDDEDTDKIMMMQQSERLALEYRKRLHQTQHQMDSLYTKLHKSKQNQQALKNRNMQLIHKLALLSHQGLEESEDEGDCCKVQVVEKDDGSKTNTTTTFQLGKSDVGLFIKCCMVLCLLVVLSGGQACFLAFVVFCWWLMETI